MGVYLGVWYYYVHKVYTLCTSIDRKQDKHVQNVHKTCTKCTHYMYRLDIIDY